MKTRIIVLSAIFAVLSFAVVSQNSAESKPKKEAHEKETRVGKGLRMEDKDQFN